MIKTNIKIRVTPEQQEKICSIIKKECCVYCKYIVITDSLIAFMDDAASVKIEEVDADLFIRTNGTCEEVKLNFEPMSCKTCTHDDDCSMQQAARLSGNDYGFWCSVHTSKL